MKEGKPVDNAGNVIPWMNYPVLEFLANRLEKDFHLFEFGSGYSTGFYARLVNRVTSVEYDASWFRLVKDTLPENVALIYKEKDVDGEYCRVIRSTGNKYDVVVVDGRDRVNCIKQAIGALTDRGVILLDDSQRDEYREGILHAKQMGFRDLSLEGLKPTGSGMDRTTILYRHDNCFGL
ncbi:MAG: FkbM family methyltransferase [Nitrospirae bacterium]|nr:FkbM family methyltransferase [Nitrospirota bacterium]